MTGSYSPLTEQGLDDPPQQPTPLNRFIKFGLASTLSIILLFFTVGLVSKKQPLVILISIDAFKPSYIPNSPTLSALSAKGTSASYLKPCFPASTFPNHWTIATGLLPQSHGIIANNFYDADVKQFFRTWSTDPFWWNGEAIWTTVTRQKKQAGVMMWPGLDVKNQIEIKYNQTYKNLSPLDKIDIIGNWLENGLDLLMLYFPEVDHAGHANGTRGVQQAISIVDTAIKRLVELLEKKRIEANIVIVSDHGMADLSIKRAIDTSQWGLHDKNIVVENNFEFLLIYVVKGNISDYYERLGRFKGAGWNLYNRSSVPGRFDFKNGPRVPDILALADIGWVFSTKASRIHGGGHGYDPDEQDMRAIFIANGPFFPERIISEEVRNIEIYNLVCKLVQVTPSPNNGTGKLLNLIKKF